jgi:hypothetical protein
MGRCYVAKGLFVGQCDYFRGRRRRAGWGYDIPDNPEEKGFGFSSIRDKDTVINSLEYHISLPNSPPREGALYSDHVHPRSFEDLVADHAARRRTLAFGQSPGMNRHLSVCARAPALGQRPWVHDEHALDDLWEQ